MFEAQAAYEVGVGAIIADVMVTVDVWVVVVVVEVEMVVVVVEVTLAVVGAVVVVTVFVVVVCERSVSGELLKQMGDTQG